MKTRYYLMIIAALVIGIAFTSYMTYVYIYSANFLPAQEVTSTLAYRSQICDLQQQLGYERCEVDGLVLDFDDLGYSSPHLGEG